MNLATIDIGTNSVLLSIFRGSNPAVSKAVLRAIHEEATVTRLGQGVDQTRRLHPDAIERTLNCLKHYSSIIAQHDVQVLKVVGTSALRDAIGSERFRQDAFKILGEEIEIISGLREASLTFTGALHDLQLTNRAFVFDIGGGSTEMIVGDPQSKQIDFCHSLDIGSVRLNERIQPADPPQETDIESLALQVQEALKLISDDPPKCAHAVGVAGTMTTLSALSQKLPHYDSSQVHGSVCTLETLVQQREFLASLNLNTRSKLPCLSTGRADVIIAGATIAIEVMRWAQLDRVVISDKGVRYGLAHELLA